MLSFRLDLPRAPLQLERKTCSPEEFARAIGTSAERVRELCRGKRIAHVRYGRHFKIPISEIDEYLTRESQANLESRPSSQ
jgi:excisionase family DNA binding protein